MKKIRRYDLDWLRVIVFGLLILYHVGMFFVPWGWHIKNDVIYNELRLPMAFVNQWRLPILFVISGMGTRFALSFRSQKQFVRERFFRLGIPLAFGMLFIIAPQVYIERLADGNIAPGYFGFYPSQYFDGIYPEGNFSWHHLWFLPYLLVYSVILSPLFIYLRNNPECKFLTWFKRQMRNGWGLLLMIIPLYLAESLLEPFFPVKHNLVDDWFTFFNYLILFFYGYLLISVKEEFWLFLDRIRKYTLPIAIITFFAQVQFWLGEDSTLIHFIEALVKVANMIAWILVLFSYGSKYLNKKSNLLAYCNQAVYPFYILHQTITVMLAFYLMKVDYGFFIEFGLLSIGTFLGSWIIYELVIRPFRLTRILFGVKPKTGSK